MIEQVNWFALFSLVDGILQSTFDCCSFGSEAFNQVENL